jgi:excisionase family DNA binding protein
VATDHRKTRTRAERSKRGGSKRGGSKRGEPISDESNSAEPKPVETDSHDHAKEKRIEYLTARQLAEVLQVSESTVHRLRRAGRIPSVALTDRLIRFNLRDVQKALRSTTVQSDGLDADASRAQEPSPQLSFDDLFSDFSDQ